MIDFRYHVVSLVSVFIALAVGIVLGAGPLRGQLAEQLSTRVEQLGVERNQLRSDKEVAEAGVRNRDAFTTQVMPTMVADRLRGHSVVLVSLPGATSALAESLSTTLTAAGAELTGRVEIRADWTAPARSEARADLVAEWGKVLTTPSQQVNRTPQRGASSPAARPAGQDTQQVLRDLLARGLVTANRLEVGESDPVGREVLAALADQELIALRGRVSTRADLAVVLAPAVQSLVPGQPTPSPSVVDPVPEWAGLTLTLDRSSGGVVLVGPASSAGDGGTIAAIRAQKESTRLVSTVDTGGSPMGDVTAVYALAEQVSGDGASYGFAKGAVAPVPSPVPAPVTAEGAAP